MVLMGMLFDNVEKILDKAVKMTGKSKSKILGLSGVTASQYDRCVRENRAFSDAMLKAMGDSEYIDATYQQLLSWKLADEYGVENLGTAFYEVFTNLPQEERVRILADLIVIYSSPGSVLSGSSLSQKAVEGFFKTDDKAKYVQWLENLASTANEVVKNAREKGIDPISVIEKEEKRRKGK